MTDKLKEMIIYMIEDNEENRSGNSEYIEGYEDGFHDALVTLMDNLGIQHNEKYTYTI